MMKTKKTEKKKAGKRRVKNEVKITLWLLLISVALLVGFSLWGNLIHPGSSTGAVIGIGGDVNDTSNSSSDGNITTAPDTTTPESNTNQSNSSVNGTITLLPEDNTTQTNNTNTGSNTSEGSSSNGTNQTNLLTGGALIPILNTSSNESGGITTTSGEIGIEGDANATACGYVNGNITLTQNLDTAVSCFVVNASNIVIDGAGFIVNGSQAGLAYGVNITNFSNVVIKNLNVNNFSISYFITKSQNSTIFNSSGYNASNINVQLANVYGLNFTNNTINNASSNLIQLTSVNQSMFQNNYLIISNDIVMNFNNPVSQNDNITGNNISFIGTDTASSAIDMATSTTSNNINIYNNTLYSSRAVSLILSGYNGSVVNNTFYMGVKGDIVGNANAIAPTTNNFMRYEGNTILGLAQRANGIGSGSAGSNNTFRDNFINLTGGLSFGFSFTTNVGSDNLFERNIVYINNTGSGGGGPAFGISVATSSNHYVIVNNTFVNPNQAYQVQVVGNPTNYIFLNNTYRVINFTSGISTTNPLVRMQWWVTVNITAPNGTVLTGANVSAFNVTGGKEQTITTDTQGLVKFNLTESERNGSIDRWVFDTPHNITATAAGYLINFTTVNISLTNSTQINLVLSVNDTTNPSVTINSPSSTHYYNASFVINATVTDDVAVNTVQYRYENSTTNGTYTAMSQSGSYWNATFDVTSVSNGNYTFRINATDTSNNQNTTVTVTNIALDTINPQLTITLPINNSNHSTSKISIEGTASDANPDRVYVNYTALGLNLGSYTSWNFTNTTMVEGKFNVLVTANDSAGNANSSMITFTIDRTAPLVQGFNSPATKQNFTTGNMVLFNVSISNGSGTAIHAVQFQLENGTNGLVNVTASATNGTLYNFSITIGSGIDEGNRTVTIFANDTAGNMNNSVSTTFVVDRTAPTVVQLYNITEGTNTTNTKPEFVWQVNDSLSPTMTCAIIIDGNTNVSNLNASNGTSTRFTPSTALPDGHHTWSMSCNDSVRLSNVSITNNFTIDTAPPYNISLNEPTNAASQTSTTMRFNWTAMDALSSAMYCNLTLNSIVNQSNIVASNATQTNVSIDNLAVGTYSWNVTCSDAVLLANTSATQTFTISTASSGGGSTTPSAGGTSGGSSSGGGRAAPSAPSTPSTATPTRTPPRSTEPFATPTEVKDLVRDQRFTINVAPVAVATVAQEQRPTALQTALTGRAIGPPPARAVERRSLINLRKVSVTFVNKGDKAIRIAPTAKDRSPIKLANEQRTKEIVQQRIRAALLQRQIKSVQETKRISAARETATRNIAVLERTQRQLQTAKTIDEVKIALRENLGPSEKQSSEVKTLVTEVELAKTVAEAGDKIAVVLELQKKQNEELSKPVISEEKVQQKVEDTVETIKKVEEEKVQFISTTKALAPQKGLFFLPNVDGSVSYSGGHTTGKLLKTEILNSEETIVPAGQNVTKEYDVRLPITLTAKPVTLSFSTEGEEILAKEVDVKEEVRVGTALYVDPEQGIIDTYILIPKSAEDSQKSEKKYLLEFNIDERQSFFFPSSRYSELFGPYHLGGNTIFAQELSYDSQAYQGLLPISLKIYEDSELIAENDYTVDFGTGKVEEGFDQSLLTGLVVAGRVLFAGLNQNTQKYSSYLVDGVLFLVLTFFLIFGIAYLRRIAVGVIPHKPFAGAVPRRKITLMPKSIRSIFFEKELSTLNQRLSSLEKEEISGLLRQEELLTKRELGRGEEVSRVIPPQIILQPDRYKILDKELLKVQSAIERVEKTQLQRTKIRTLLSSYHPATTFASERKITIDKELEKITKTLSTAERKPTSLLRRLFSTVTAESETDAKRTKISTTRKDEKGEQKQLEPSKELIAIERRIIGLDRIKEENVKVRRDIPTLLERGKQTVREILLLEKEKAKIERNLGNISENNVGQNRQRAVQPTAELNEIEEKIANVEKETRKLKGKVLANVATVNAYERESELQEALRRQRPLQKQEIQRSAELEKIEKEIREVKRLSWQQRNKRTTWQPSISVGQNSAVEELRRLKEEYRDVELLLKGETQETLRKRRIALPVRSAELLNVEKMLAQVNTMLPEKMRIKRETPGRMPEKEEGRERKVVMDKELDAITKTLQRAEKRPISLLESLFPRWKSRPEQRKERAAAREVEMVSRAVEKGGQRHFNELHDVEQQLANVERESRERKGKVVTSVADVNVYGRETDIKDVLRERRPIKLREVKSSPELAEIDQAIKEVGKPFWQKRNIRTTIPSSTSTRQSAIVEELRKLSQEYHDVDLLLKGEMRETLRKRRIDEGKPSPELRQVENKIAQIETMFPQKMKIKREMPTTMPRREDGRERKGAMDTELDEITRVLRQAEKKPSSLLDSLFPRWKSREERKIGRAAVREVAMGSGKGGARNEKHARELREVEQRLANVERESRERRGKVVASIAPVNVYGKERDIRDVLQEQRPIKQREVKASPELVDVEKAMREVEKPFPERMYVRRTIPGPFQRNSGRTTDESAELAREYRNVDGLLQENGGQREQLQRKDSHRASPELLRVEKKLAGMDTMFQQRIKIRQEFPRAIPEREQSGERRSSMDRELEEINRALEQREKRLDSERRLWRNPKQSKELLTVEQKLKQIETAPTAKVNVKRGISPFKQEREQREERKEIIDRELEEINWALEHGGKKPTSVLRRFFPQRKSASEKKREREAVQQVARSGKKEEGKDHKSVTELSDVEKKLEKLKKELRENK